MMGVDLSPVRDLRRDAARLARWRCGVIETSGGRLDGIARRVVARRASVAGAWLDARRRAGPADRCRLYWHVPRLAPGVLSVDYVHSGRGTRLATFHAAVVVVDQVARIKGCHVAVCHVSNDRITDRLLRRWGWEAHCLGERGRHWIRRYYGEYPRLGAVEGYLASQP